MFIKEINGSLVVRLQEFRVSAVKLRKTEIWGCHSGVAVELVVPGVVKGRSDFIVRVFTART